MRDAVEGSCPRLVALDPTAISREPGPGAARPLHPRGTNRPPTEREKSGRAPPAVWTNPPGPWLKHQIAIQTDSWPMTGPGFTEVDLVAHCGKSADGEFVYSVNQTDLFSGGVETRAGLGRGQRGILEALRQMHQGFLFQVRGIDADNGVYPPRISSVDKRRAS